MKLILILAALLLPLTICSQEQSKKYEMWLWSSYFRGFNMMDEANKNYQDFTDLKNLGANFVHLNVKGFNDTEAPYGLLRDTVDHIDRLISYCRDAGLYYTLAVRTGPGRNDVYLESEGIKPKSTIWQNPDEQAHYAGMVARMAERYANDELFVGIAPFVEPNPEFGIVPFNDEYVRDTLAKMGINLRAINKQIVDSIRKYVPGLPVIVQNVVYSSAEFFSLMEPQEDPFVVCEVHCYRPMEYVKSEDANTKTYPGRYLSFNDSELFRTYDREFIRDHMFRFVRQFREEQGTPVLLGEFGLMLPQINGTGYLADICGIADELGWHFALWDWRGKRARGCWDYEAMPPEYMDTIRHILKNNPNSVEVTINNKAEYPMISPNPVENTALITIGRPTFESLEIFDIFGRPVPGIRYFQKHAAQAGSECIVVLGGIPPGVYYLQILSGREILSGSFVKTGK